jgi:hypothetical protein
VLGRSWPCAPQCLSQWLLAMDDHELRGLHVGRNIGAAAKCWVGTLLPKVAARLYRSSDNEEQVLIAGEG